MLYPYCHQHVVSCPGDISLLSPEARLRRLEHRRLDQGGVVAGSGRWRRVRLDGGEAVYAATNSII